MTKSSTRPATVADLEAALAAALAENEQLKKTKSSATRLKISPKGCITLHGLRGSYGASYYPNEWDFIISQADAIKTFMTANKERLSWK
jgi:hypothetical protein